MTVYRVSPSGAHVVSRDLTIVGASRDAWVVGAAGAARQFAPAALTKRQRVEFYHDTGGVTWTRQDMIANTEKYVCGKFRRYG